MQNFDIAIIGGGPAGLSACVTASVRNKSVVIFDHHGFSPRLRKAHKINNYLGMPDLNGEEMMDKFVEHAKSYNPTIIKEKVLSIYQGDEDFSLITSNSNITASTIIIAIGVSNSKVLPGEKEFLGRGISYCATCDGFFYKNKKIATISTSPNDLEEIEFLAEICSEVILLPLYKFDSEKIKLKHDNITVLNEMPKEITGTTSVTGIRTENEYIPLHGVFIFRDSDPIDVLIPNLSLSGKSIMTYDNLETNIPGIFAAGDCTGQPWQISRATGQGLTAALSAVSYLNK